MFNADKSNCIFFPILSFTHEGLFFTLIMLLNMSSSQWPYLGHVISSDLDDKHDVSRGRSALVSQINNVLCFFRTLDSVIKMRFAHIICYSLFGCIIWDITSVHVEKVCSAWRAGVHRVWGLPLSILTMR